MTESKSNELEEVLKAEGQNLSYFENKILKALKAYTMEKDLAKMIEYALDSSSLVRSHLAQNPNMDLDLARVMYKDEKPEVKHSILSFLSKILNQEELTSDEILQLLLISLYYVITDQGEVKRRAKVLLKRLFAHIKPLIRQEIITKLDAITLAEIVRNIDLTPQELDQLLLRLEAEYPLAPKRYLLTLENIVMGRNLLNLTWETLKRSYMNPNLSPNMKVLIAQMIVRYISVKGFSDEIAKDIINLGDWKLMYMIARELDSFDHIPNEFLSFLLKRVPSIVRLKLATNIALPLKGMRALSLDRNPVVRRALLKRGDVPLYVKLNAQRVSKMMKKIRRPKRVKWLRRFKIFDITLSLLKKIRGFIK